MSIESLQETPQLSDRLAIYVPAEKLGQNAANYSEMQRSFEGEDAVRLERIRQQLERLPLVHTTHRTRDQIADGLRPYVDRPTDMMGHTGSLDESLGLDHYSFLHWGVAEKSSYGSNHVLLDAALLKEPGCVVTPTDINALVADLSRPFDEQDPAVQQKIQERYFDKMVTGKDWFEIIARRLLVEAKYTNGEPPVLSPRLTGEVKILNGVSSPDAIQDFVTPETEQGLWKRLIELGFIPGPVDRSQYAATPYDVSAEQLGTSLGVAQNVWRDICS